MTGDFAAISPWGIYEDQYGWPVSASGIFMAKAVEFIGPAVSESWANDMPDTMRVNPPVPIPVVECAFEPDGTPVASVHAEYAEVVRLLTPEGPAEDCTLPIDADRWFDACVDASRLIGDYRAAQIDLTLVAKTLQSLVLSEKVRCYARPIGGSVSGTIDLPREYWEIDDPLPRLAWCGVDMANPLDRGAPPSHWIFVNEVDLLEAKSLIKQKMHSYHPERKWSDYAPKKSNEPELVKDYGHNPTIEDRVRRFLESDFRTQGTEIKKPEFYVRACDKTGLQISETNWRGAWKKAVKDYPERSRGGRPPKTKPKTSPTMMQT